MKLDYHIKLNNVSIKKLLASVLSLQIALWAVIGLSALGLSIPIVQPLIGFIYLAFVPGILILVALRLRHLDIVETALYAVGLSVTVVLGIGLVNNFVLSAVNTIKPFSFPAVASSASFVVLLLCAVAYYRNRTNLKTLFITERSAPLAPTLFLCILPFVAVFSTYLVNTYNVDAGQLLLWLIIGVVVLLIAFDKFIPSQLYPLAVFVIALSLLFQQTLISEWLIGADIQGEWGLANSVLNTGIWNWNLLNHYDGMLSIVALAPIYSLISNLSLIWVFKLVYSFIFAVVPVALYQVFRRQLNDKVAFLSCFFFVSFAGFYLEMPELARQEVAEFFCVLLILVLVSNEMNQAIQSALFVVFGLSMVVSHYGLTYVIVFFFFVTWLTLTVARIDKSKLTLRYLRTKFGIHKDKRIIAASPKPPPRSTVTIIPIAVLFIASIAWYAYTAQSTAVQSLLTLGSHIAGSVGQLLSPTYSQAANVVAKGPVPGILHQVNAVVNYLNQFFILAGVCLAIFLTKQRFKLQFWYIALSVVALGFLIASIVVPWLGAALNNTRVYQITLIVLAPFLTIGFITIGETAGATIRKITSKLGFGNVAIVSHSRLTRLLAIYLVLFLLLSTGFLFALTEGYQNSSLSNQVDGVLSHQTIVAATWATSQASSSGTIPLSGKLVTIFHYFNNVRYDDTTKRTNSDGQITLNQTFSSAGQFAYYATFAGDTSYSAATSAVVNVQVGSNQAANQSTTNVGALTTITLSASTTTPAVGQPVTFTATLTSGRVIYGDYYTQFVLDAIAPGQGLNLPAPQNGSAGSFYLFLSTYNIAHNEALVSIFEGANKQDSYTNVTPLISNRSLIYSNGGASVYS